MKRLMLYLVILVVIGPAPLAQPSYYEVPDVPTDLPAGGTTFLPWEIVANNGGAYLVTTSLPANTPIDAVHRMPGGWLLSVNVPTDLGGITWDPRDVFRWDGAASFTSHPAYSGALAQIPPGSNVDAVFLDPSGAVIVSFDVPTTIGSVTYDPSDLVRYDGAIFNVVPYFDASAAGIPETSNLTAADRRGWLTVLSLDVPTATGTSVFRLPGELTSWDGIALLSFDPQPGWPSDRSSRVNALTFDPMPVGSNPGVVGPSLTVERLDATLLRLRWSTSNCSGGTDTGIYQGTLASLHLPAPAYDHTLIDCSDGFPFMQEDVPLPGIDAYFLVVSHDDVTGEEGSYGRDDLVGAMNERPRGLANCVPAQALGCP